MVEIQVLGAFGATAAGQVIDLGGPRQRSVLALLLVARGDVVSVDRLIDGLWRGEPPPRAISALQAYVSNLRRALEPDRPPRAPATTLVSIPPGYAVRLPAEAVDAWQFEVLLARAGNEADPATARDLLRQALDLWHGPAYAEVADEPWAIAEAGRLGELRLNAREQLIDSTLRSARTTAAAAGVIPEAEAMAAEHPLREEGWRLLALARHAAGRRADALAALRQARHMLVEETGLEPGPALRELEADLLADRLPVLSPAPVAVSPAAETRQGAVPARAFVGRDAELQTLRAAARAARPDRPAVVLVAGDPGAGKSALVNEFRRRLEDDGWRPTLGRCPEAEGAPPAWAWVEALRGLAAEVGPGSHAREVAPLLGEHHRPAGDDESFARFRMHHAIGDWLREAASRRPLAVVLDDLHRADDETLALLRSVAEPREREASGGGPLLLLATYRPAEVAGEQVEETLAALARRSPTRVRLDGLGRDDVARLVEQVAGAQPDEQTLAALAERTGGNPFYLTESAKLLASEGELVAISEVPEGVRDVLRRRLARLPESCVTVLRLAAAIGRDVDVGVLLNATELDEDTALAGLEAGVLAGLLGEPVPGQVRFAHVLVRETLYGDLPRLRRSRLHARIAAALERVHPGDLAGLAHHHAQAGTPATAELAVGYSVRAAELATGRFAHGTAVNLYRQALDALERVPGGAGDDRRVDLLCRLARTQISAGATQAATVTRATAIAVAERSGRDDLLIQALIGWYQPTPWITRRYVERDDHVIGLTERVLGADLAPDVRCRLLCVLIREMGAGEGGPRARHTGPQALAEAFALAHQLDDPLLLAYVIATEYQVVIPEDDLPGRARVAQQLIDLGERCEAPMYVYMGIHAQAQNACTVGDLASVRASVRRESALADRYQLASAQETTLMTRGAIEHLAGRLAEAEAAYLEAGAAISRHGAVDAGGIMALAFMTLRLSEGRLPEMLPALEQLADEFGPIVADMLCIARAQVGSPDAARQARTVASPITRDFLFVLLVAIRAKALTCLADPTLDGPEAEQVYADLLPYADQVAGGGTASFVLGPTATSLGDLALLLGRTEDAHAHYGQALAVARRCGNAHWEAAAAAGLSVTGGNSRSG